MDTFKEEYQRQFATGCAVPEGAYWEQGVTMLDYFAAKALQAIMATPEHYRHRPAMEAANEAYKYAASMMEARKLYLLPENLR